MANVKNPPKPRPPEPVADAVKADAARRAREAAAKAGPKAAPKARKIAATSPAGAPASSSHPTTPARLHLGDLFPDATPAAIADAVAAWWDTAGPLPIPRAPIACPVCAGVAYPRAWNVYRLPTPGKVAHSHRHPWRCDISMKCHRCSAVWAHGLAIIEDQARQYGANTGAAGAVAYTWRQARDRLAGYLKG